MPPAVLELSDADIERIAARVVALLEKRLPAVGAAGQGALSANTEETVSLEEAADFLKATPERVLGLTKIGLLPHVAQEGTRRIRLSDLVAFRRFEEERAEHSKNSPLSRFFADLHADGLYYYNGEDTSEVAEAR